VSASFVSSRRRGLTFLGTSFTIDRYGEGERIGTRTGESEDRGEGGLEGDSSVKADKGSAKEMCRAPTIAETGRGAEGRSRYACVFNVGIVS
jgi:hypothetical protein